MFVGSSTIASPGVGSGINVNDLVTSLVNAEIQPASSRLDFKEASVQAKISAVGNVSSALSSLSSSLSELTTIANFNKRAATSSDTKVLSATALNTASAGSYNILVQHLAQAHSVASSAFTSTTEVIGTGEIRIDFGTYSAGNTVFTPNADKPAKTLTINSGEQTVEGIKNAINKSNLGVSASIITDASGPRLVITSNDTGEKSALKITVTDSDGNHTNNSGLSRLVFDPSNAVPVTNLTQTNEAKNSLITVNGIDLSNATNTVAGAISGVTLNLQSTSASTIKLDISNDKTAVQTAINKFVTSFNETMELLDAVSKYDSKTQTAAILNGDSTIRNLKSSLRGVIANSFSSEVNPNLRSLATIGITTNASGQLEVDSTKLSSAIDKHFDEVGRLFARSGVVSDSQLQVTSFGASSPKAGRYAINLTALNLGTSIEGTIGGLALTSTDGRTITGTGNLTPISLQVIGGSTGNRGSLVISEGAAVNIRSVIDQYLGSSGLLTQKNNGLTQQVTDINTEREKLALRSQSLTRRYLTQFNAMDSLVSSLQSTGSYLTSTLANLPGAVSNNSK
ncbi:MAG: flagellar filament capping protein FliD [Legionellales bacterium]|nr:flagellar filament capping protein FliD [Legionellales bacterium]